MQSPTPQAPESPAAALPSLDGVRAVVGRTRRRLRAQRAVQGAVTWALPGAALAALALLAWRLGWLPGWALGRTLLVAAVLPVGGALLGAARRLEETRVAWLLDRSHRLHDRFGSALEFTAEGEPTPFMAAQVRDAVARIDAVSPARAAPFRRPRRLRALGLCLLLVGAASLARPLPAEPAPRPAPAAMVPGVELDPEVLAAQRDLLEELKQQADSEVPEASELARELERLLDKLQREELTRKELFDKLAALERRYFDGLEGDFEALLKKLKKMGGELKKERPTREAGQALQEAKLRKAQKELADLAKRLKELNSKERQRLARRLDRAAAKPLAGDRSHARQNRALERERRRLKRDQKKNPNNAETRRRLRRNKRQLERLNRQARRRQEQRRQLDRLNKDLKRTAAGLRSRMNDQARSALQDAARRAGKFADQVNRARVMKRAEGQLADLKQILRRAGKGKKGKKGKMQDFYVRANQGKQGKGKGEGKGMGKGKEGKGKGEGKKAFLLDPNGDGQGTMVMSEQGSGSSGQGGEEQMTASSSDGVGDGPGPDLKGEKTDLDGKRRASLVRGKEAGGPSRSEVILGASDQGFAERNYRRVYRDYNGVVEDVLRREDVPLGYRYYVKRYFQLIRPR